MSTQTDTLGVAFAYALAAKDTAALVGLLHPAIDFRGMTPRRIWEGDDPETIVGEVFYSWFEPSDEIERVEHVETDRVGDRERVGYRFRVRNPDGDHVVEQQAYLVERDGRIGWLRVMCSGFCPVSD
jgi:hypothetical protein